MKRSPLRLRHSGIVDEDRDRYQCPGIGRDPGPVAGAGAALADTHTILPKVAIDFPRDRKDAAFLICAQSGKADYLITGDGDFSEAQAFCPRRCTGIAFRTVIDAFANVPWLRT
jgi:hypothetical protein